MSIMPSSRNYSRKNRPVKEQTHRETISDFAENSTTHGIAYIFERDVHYWSRLSWLITVLALFVLGIFMIMSLYKGWKDSPITTTIEDPAVPIQEIDFPAITLCGMGTMSDLVEVAYSRQLREYLISKGVDVTAFDEKDTKSQVYMEAFGPTYQEELYGKLERLPHFFAELMMTLNPDEFLKSKVMAGLTPLCSSTSLDKCPEGSSYDEGSNLCYLARKSTDVASEASRYCRSELMETFMPTSDDQLLSIATLIMEGRGTSSFKKSHL